VRKQMLTLMAVHAHPDDEASSTGGVLARYAAEGATTVLVTCTDGRCGDGPGGEKPGDPGHDPEAVVEVRRAELRASAEILGITHVERLEYRDSGMMGWPTNDDPRSFWQSPLPESAARIADLIRRHRPDVVVTYDDNGFYGHPDHIQANRATMAALELLSPEEMPAKIYWTAMPRRTMEAFGAKMRANGMDIPEPSEEAPAMGLPDEQISTWVDAQPYVKAKFEALGAHASQPDNAFFLSLGVTDFADLFAVETFRLIRGGAAGVREEDLFAGLH
jgi:LmbE family N-acetylglucosaminyl deacetylase